MSSETTSMESVSNENRKFPPPAAFAKNAHIGSMDAYKELYDESVQNPEGFWSEAAEELHWFKKWDKVLDASEAPFYKWYTGSRTNLSYNCLDRHIEEGRGDKIAIHWEGEPGDRRDISYSQLHEEVCRFANGLKARGVRKGDRIAIYLPMRIGAVHSVIFAGFSADAIRDRVLDSETRMVITADGGYRRGKVLQLKKIVDEGIESCECIKDVVVVKRGDAHPIKCDMKNGRDACSHQTKFF